MYINNKDNSSRDGHSYSVIKKCSLGTGKYLVGKSTYTVF